jgi:hypothetical protein
VLTPLINPADPVPSSGIYEVTIPAAYATSDNTYYIKYDLANSAGQPGNHPAYVYLILNPELVQVAYTNPIPATFPLPTPSTTPEE